MTALLASGNIINVSAGTTAVPVNTEKTALEKNTIQKKKNAPDYAPFSQLVNMQKTTAPIRRRSSRKCRSENAETETYKSEENSATDYDDGSDSDGSVSIMTLFQKACRTPVDSVMLPV